MIEFNLFNVVPFFVTSMKEFEFQDVLSIESSRIRPTVKILTQQQISRSVRPVSNLYEKTVGFTDTGSYHMK